VDLLQGSDGVHDPIEPFEKGNAVEASRGIGIHHENLGEKALEQMSGIEQALENSGKIALREPFGDLELKGGNEVVKSLTGGGFTVRWAVRTRLYVFHTP
jgi:hypothetical protein